MKTSKLDQIRELMAEIEEEIHEEIEEASGRSLLLTKIELAKAELDLINSKIQEVENRIDPDQDISATRAAKLLLTSTATLDPWLRDGILRTRRSGAKKYISKADLQLFKEWTLGRDLLSVADRNAVRQELLSKGVKLTPYA